MSKYSKGHSIIGFNPDGRPANDFYATPRIGTLSLMAEEKFNGVVWECACGDGSMSKVLEEEYAVISTDIEPRKYGSKLDFLKSTELWAPNIITNPPFRLSQQFAEHALSLGCEKLALLNKLQFLEGIKRTEFLKYSPLKRVLVFQKRLTIMRPGLERGKRGGMIAYAWYIWEKDYMGRPMIDWI